MRIRLSGADREKYGVPEWIEFDENRLGLREVAVMRRATKWTSERLFERLRGVEVWEDGQLVTRPVVDDNGAPVLDDDGEPVVEPVREPDTEAMAIIVWLALRRLGKTVLWNDDFDIDANGLDIETDEDAEGKATATTTS